CSGRRPPCQSTHGTQPKCAADEIKHTGFGGSERCAESGPGDGWVVHDDWTV
ncbi:MAG: hypothetical protein M1830_009721, partial [Pleopsidium flavum]